MVQSTILFVKRIFLGHLAIGDYDRGGSRYLRCVRGVGCLCGYRSIAGKAAIPARIFILWISVDQRIQVHGRRRLS
jgi:hypothetical protein